MGGRVKVGISSCFFHADPLRPIFKGKTLLYLEQSLSNWVAGRGALPFLIPALPQDAPVRASDYLSELDGLILQGGSDVAPESYGEKALRPEWTGDIVRDRYELELFQLFRARQKPVLGVCRGAQILNVAYGGTLYQDLALQAPGAITHRNWEIYDANQHDIRFEEGALLSRLFRGSNPKPRVNSIHHQGIKILGAGLKIEARSLPDQQIEAIRAEGEPFVCAVQWHPEFHADPALLDCRPLLDYFLNEAERRRGN